MRRSPTGRGDSRSKSKSIFRALTLILCHAFAFTPTAHAQEISSSSARTPPSIPARTNSQQQEEESIEPSRPGVANPAEIQSVGVLQLEYGYDGLFHSDEFRSQQTTPLALRFAAHRRLLLELDLDTVISEVDRETEERETGIGDTRLGFQVVVLEDTEEHPALAFAYYVKLPSASEERGLGTGRTDHRVVALLSKKVGETDLDFNVTYLNVGREDSRRASGGQAAFSVSREFGNDLGYVAELYGQSVDDQQPRGIYALGALTYRTSQRVRFDAGMRFGLNPAAPRVGAFAGVTVSLGNFFRK